MNRWVGKIALVTGASAGIGEAIVDSLVKHGMKVVSCARNLETLEETAKTLNQSGPGEVFPVRCDVASEEQVLEMFRKIKEKYGVLHVCINNAGLAKAARLLEGTFADWNSMLSVNVIGLCLCTREAVKLMENGGIDDGHIIHINSMSGHRVIPSINTHFYAATKHAVTALAQGLRNELRMKKSHTRVSCVSPGLVETEFAYRMFDGNSEKAKEKYSSIECLTAGDMADAVIYALSAPARVNVCDIHVKPTEQNS